MLNSNYIEENLTSYEKNMVYSNYYVLNPFGFGKNSIYFANQRTIINYKTGSGGTISSFKEIKLNLSEKCKQGFNKIVIDFPHY